MGERWRGKEGKFIDASHFIPATWTISTLRTCSCDLPVTPSESQSPATASCWAGGTSRAGSTPGHGPLLPSAPEVYLLREEFGNPEHDGVPGHGRAVALAFTFTQIA